MMGGEEICGCLLPCARSWVRGSLRAGGQRLLRPEGIAGVPAQEREHLKEQQPGTAPKAEGLLRLTRAQEPIAMGTAGAGSLKDIERRQINHNFIYYQMEKISQGRSFGVTKELRTPMDV